MSVKLLQAMIRIEKLKEEVEDIGGDAGSVSLPYDDDFPRLSHALSQGEDMSRKISWALSGIMSELQEASYMADEANNFFSDAIPTPKGRR